MEGRTFVFYRANVLLFYYISQFFQSYSIDFTRKKIYNRCIKKQAAAKQTFVFLHLLTSKWSAKQTGERGSANLRV